jgi:glycosyltransferase involved in cell wall biosynthesis
MPTYNRANYIGEAIESIRSQTYRNWELAIIDDGSNDNTEEMIKNIDDKRIIFFRAGRVGIPGKIKNIGLKLITGEMIAFMDSDDLWENTKLEKQLIALQEHDEAMFCLTNGYDFKKINEPVKYFYKQREGIKHGNLLNSFLRSEAAATVPTLMLKRECLQITGLFDETKPLSDVYFILNLAAHFRGVILYEPLFYRRLHNSNDSNMHWMQRHYEGIEMLKSYRGKVSPELLANCLFRSYIHFGEKCLTHSKKQKAICGFLQAWKHKPFSIVPLRKIAKTFFY